MSRRALVLPLPLVALTAVFLSALHAADGVFHSSWDSPFLYECSRGEVLRSLYSEHDNRREDRRWRFGCKKSPANDNLPQDCHWTGYVNGWDAVMSFVCPADAVITGLQSYHSNSKEDRRFKFKCCSQAGYKTYSCSLTPHINSWDRVLNYVVPRGKVITGVGGYHSNSKEDRLYQFFVCRYGRLRFY